MNEEFNKALKQLDEQLKQTNSVKKLFDNIEYIKYDGLENLTDEFYSQSVKTPPRNFTNKDGVNKQKEFYALQDLVREYEYLFRTIPYGIFYLADDIKRPMLVIGQIIRVNGSSEFMKNDVIYCLGTIIFNSSHYSQDFYIEHYGREVIVGNKDVLVRPPTFLNKEEHSYGRWREYGYRKDIERKKLLKSKLEEIFAYREDYLEGLKNEADEIQVQAIEQTIKRHCERLNKKANNWEYELVSLKSSRLSGDFSGTLKLSEMEDELYDLENDLSEQEIKTNPRVNNLKQKIEEYVKERKVFGNTLCRVTNLSDNYVYGDEESDFVIYFAINSKREIMLMQFTPKTFESTDIVTDDIISKI